MFKNFYKRITRCNAQEFRTDTGPYIVSLDFSQAFDTVSHEFLKYSLQKYGIPNWLEEMIYQINNSAKSAIQTDKHLSFTIDIKRSVRQGCPMSPILFALVTNPLLKMIQGNNNIEGRQNNKGILKVMAHADDITVCLANGSSLVHLCEAIKNFTKFSGLAQSAKSSPSKLTSIQTLSDKSKISEISKLLPGTCQHPY